MSLRAVSTHGLGVVRVKIAVTQSLTSEPRVAHGASESALDARLNKFQNEVVVTPYYL